MIQERIYYMQLRYATSDILAPHRTHWSMASLSIDSLNLLRINEVNEHGLFLNTSTMELTGILLTPQYTRGK